MTKIFFSMRTLIFSLLFLIQFISYSQVNTGNGLYAENVFLTSDGKKIDRDIFYYGEVINVNFENLTGLTEVNDYVFPGMSITVVDNNMDTVFLNPDLYQDITDGVNFKPLQLTAKLTCANPMHSGNSYTLLIHIWDKKGKGNNDLKMNFKIVRNPDFIIKNQSASFEEAYIFSMSKNNVINNNEIALGEKIYYVIEGINGFKTKDGKISAGMSMNVTDDEGKVILFDNDLIENHLFTEEEFQARISASFIMQGMVVKNPVKIELVIWDKQGDSKIELTSILKVML